MYYHLELREIFLGCRPLPIASSYFACSHLSLVTIAADSFQAVCSVQYIFIFNEGFVLSGGGGLFWVLFLFFVCCCFFVSVVIGNLIFFKFTYTPQNIHDSEPDDSLRYHLFLDDSSQQPIYIYSGLKPLI